MNIHKNGKEAKRAPFCLSVMLPMYDNRGISGRDFYSYSQYPEA